MTLFFKLAKQKQNKRHVPVPNNPSAALKSIGLHMLATVVYHNSGHRLVYGCQIIMGPDDPGCVHYLAYAAKLIINLCNND